MSETAKKIECLDVKAWRAYTRQEMLGYLRRVGCQAKQRDDGRVFKSLLVVRQHLSPVDTYCYLKARFGDPNGFQTMLRRDTSDNWIHWDFNLKAGVEDVYIAGTHREIHFMLSEELADEDWPSLILAVKSDFARVATKKIAVLKSLEKWVIFPNKFVEVAAICADLHGEIASSIKKVSPYRFPKYTQTGSEQTQVEATKKLAKFASQSLKLFRNCLELSLITPVLAEAFINMTVLILCKEEIRSNDRQFDSFIRSQIDVKIFDLPYKCRGFARAVDPNSLTYRNFKRVMDKRNHAIHGNIDPQREQIEVVYFEGKRPLFEEQGDHIAKHFEALAKQREPEKVIKDYEDTYAFLVSVADCLEPSLKSDFWRIMEDQYPGYDLERRITGVLFPEAKFTGYAQGTRFDDELAVSWKTQ